MKIILFINKLNEIVKKHRTVYMWGTFGQKVTNQLINQKIKQYPSWYTTSRVKHFRSLVNKNYYAFDCVGLIKGILWGWNEGKIKYISNNVPDINADMMINRCKNISTDFSKIKEGNAVWVKGHIGIYIGDGLVIECTPAWKNNVQYSTINNKKGYNKRKWTKHGELPYLDSNVFSKSINDIAKDVIKGKYGNMPNRKILVEKEGYSYEDIRVEVNKILS